MPINMTLIMVTLSVYQIGYLLGSLITYKLSILQLKSVLQGRQQCEKGLF